MDINKLVEFSHQVALEKGWHDKKRSPLEIHALIHSEVSEATEEARKGTHPTYYAANGKPEGEAIELADAIIRICDYFGARGWNLEEAIEIKMKYNLNRSYRHGGKLF